MKFVICCFMMGSYEILLLGCVCWCFFFYYLFILMSLICYYCLLVFKEEVKCFVVVCKYLDFFVCGYFCVFVDLKCKLYI